MNAHTCCVRAHAYMAFLVPVHAQEEVRGGVGRNASGAGARERVNDDTWGLPLDGSPEGQEDAL